MRHWNRNIFMFILFVVVEVTILVGSLYQLGKGEQTTQRMVTSVVEGE